MGIMKCSNIGHINREGFIMIVKIGSDGVIRIPTELISLLGLSADTELEMTVTKGQLILRKAIHGCIFCGSAMALVRLGEGCACKCCISRMHEAQVGDWLYIVKMK